MATVNQRINVNIGGVMSSSVPKSNLMWRDVSSMKMLYNFSFYLLFVFKVSIVPKAEAAVNDWDFWDHHESACCKFISKPIISGLKMYFSNQVFQLPKTFYPKTLFFKSQTTCPQWCILVASVIMHWESCLLIQSFSQVIQSGKYLVITLFQQWLVEINKKKIKRHSTARRSPACLSHLSR